MTCILGHDSSVQFLPDINGLNGICFPEIIQVALLTNSFEGTGTLEVEV